MIHLATLHYRSAAWIDLQLDYIERYTDEPYRVWGCLDHIDRSRFARFHHAEHRGEGIAEEFDYLAGLIAADPQTRPDDLLVFLHGDTFPIARWAGPVREMLAREPLAGIRRDENLGEPHPHACFTATTVGLWEELGLTWMPGPEWVGTDGQAVTDLGAVLWQQLADAGVGWEPILRSNARDLHPLWYGVYGGIVYHHGAAFRMPISRVDSAPSRDDPVLLQKVRRLRIALGSQRLSRRLYRRLIAGDEFFRELVDGPVVAAAAPREGTGAGSR